MSDNIKLLEDRVERTAKRLKSLAAERNRLENEVQRLQTRLEVLDRKRFAGESCDTPPRDVAEGWEEQRAEVAAALQEAIAELRG